ncbi:hypothetical protein [Falsiroseomonas stagni]|uniref:Uncharacterized protein n=1 Tax=Falsiroseomonas stagni DSM 19981 TaxID=1123062 RepID=A0A1I4BXS0_9PROT|nr:hypothetical protein [Falsiroseomonas stagni]SFK72899.1 hypothetical protein SAMN02745775_106191 [Falsiroseomonas stagni DSM 19981]
MTARRLALALPLLAALASPAAAQREGVYDVTGINLDGSPYTGVAQIRAAGLSSFFIAWRISGQVVEGVGFASGRTISVAYGLASRPGMGIYTLNPDGSMDGEWTIVGAPANARERLVPRAAAPVPPAASATPPAPAASAAPAATPAPATPPAARPTPAPN